MQPFSSPPLPFGNTGPACRVVYEVIESAALAGNRFADPTSRVTSVILPPSYDREPSRRYPVLYLLHTFAGTGWQQLARAPFSESLDERLARLYAADPAMPECIVVLPDCCTALGGSQYVNSPVLGRYEDHITQEVIPLVDRRYRTLAQAAHRAVVGRSSGGIGALWLAMRHPQLFSAVASHAGDGYFRVTLVPELLRFCRAVRRYGGPEGALSHWLGLGKGPRDPALFDVMTVLANGAAYSPADTPLGFELPVDWRTAKLDEAVLARWLRFDPVEICHEAPYRQALEGMRLIYLDAGTRDEYFLDLATRRLAARLGELGISVTHEEFDDGHRNTTYRLDRSLPLLARAVA
jgi:enterochelin esterase family protein